MNSDIRATEVLLIDVENTKRGVISTKEALEMADTAGLDLVEVAPQAKPPVCRIMDYGKYRFQQQKREKDARKKQKNQGVKEIKMRPKIDQHDYNFKVKAIKSFLKSGHRVKVSIFFRGREMAFLDRGRDVLNRVMAEIVDLGKMEMDPRMEGSYMRIMIAPSIQPEVAKKVTAPKAGSSTVEDKAKKEVALKTNNAVPKKELEESKKTEDVKELEKKPESE